MLFPNQRVGATIIPSRFKILARWAVELCQTNNEDIGEKMLASRGGFHEKAACKTVRAAVGYLIAELCDISFSLSPSSGGYGAVNSANCWETLSGEILCSSGIVPWGLGLSTYGYCYGNCGQPREVVVEPRATPQRTPSVQKRGGANHHGNRKKDHR